MIVPISMSCDCGSMYCGFLADPHITQPCIGSHPVQRTAVTRRSTVEHMGLDHGRFDIAMAQQFLNSSNLIPAFEQVGSERIWKTRDS